MADTVEKSQKATKIDVVSFTLNDSNILTDIKVNANGTFTSLHLEDDDSGDSFITKTLYAYKATISGNPFYLYSPEHPSENKEVSYIIAASGASENKISGPGTAEFTEASDSIFYLGNNYVYDSSANVTLNF